MENLDTDLPILYVMVDDLCKQHQLSQPTHPGPSPNLGISEVITLALLGQWSRFPSERAFYRWALRHLKAAFPLLPNHSQFVRQEHACAQWIEQVACLLAEQRPGQTDELYQILDAPGVPVRCIKRRGGVNAVLDRQNDCLRPDEGVKSCERRPDIIHFDTEQHQINRPDLLLITRRMDRERERSSQTRLDGETIATKRF